LIRLFCFKGLILSSQRKKLSKDLRKKKKKYANLIMLLLILFVLLFIAIQNKNITVSSEELVSSYTTDIAKADKKLLNQELIVTGKAKSFIQFEDEKSLLELESGSDVLNIYCIIVNKETEAKVVALTTGTMIKVYGKCLGLNPLFSNKFTDSIFIEAEQIK
jgi:hypothetical protein